jgi:hypothetical protein
MLKLVKMKVLVVGLRGVGTCICRLSHVKHVDA